MFLHLKMLLEISENLLKHLNKTLLIYLFQVSILTQNRKACKKIGIKHISIKFQNVMQSKKHYFYNHQHNQQIDHARDSE